MGKSVGFSEPTRALSSEPNVDGELEDVEALNETQNRQFNKFELLGLLEGANSGDPSAGNADENSIDEDTCKDKQIESVHTKSKKRKSRKRGKKGSKNKNKDLCNLDDELNNLTNAIVLHPSANRKRDENLRFKMLRVDMRNLIPESEIKRMFGRGVIKEEKSNRIRQHPGSNLQRSRFVSAGYLEAKSSGGFSGLKMDLDEEVNNARRSDFKHTTGHDPRMSSADSVESSSALFNSDEPIYFKFVHDKSYQEAQIVFLQAVNQGHPERIVQNLTLSPFHAESLIQLSHMVRVSEDYKTASEFIERALIVFENSFHPRFNLATANCRLTYRRPENRAFFITIFKHIIYCHRRGLRRTPFEYSKLLLSLEPENDPLQAIQLIDFFALRSEECDYVIDFYQKWERAQKLPNMSFSVALAYFMKSRITKQTREENSKYLGWADQFLQKALIVFPNFVIPLLDACSLEPNDNLKKCTYFDYSVYGTNYKLVSETVEVMVGLYVKRNYILWKQKLVMEWLEKNVEILVNKFKSGELIDDRRQVVHWHAFPKVVPKNLLRHIVLCDLDMRIPSSASSTTFLDIDPYPPTDSIISYNSRWNENSQSSPSGSESLLGNLGGLFLRSFLPSFNLNDQNQQTGPPTDRGPAQTSSGSSRGQQDSNHARSSSNQGPQITMADYLTDDNDANAGQAGASSVQYNDMSSAISDLVTAIADLIHLRPAIRAHLDRVQGSLTSRHRNGNNDLGDDGTGEEGEGGEGGDRRNP